MEVVHSIMVNIREAPEYRKKADDLGISYKLTDLPGDGNALIHFEIAESHANWQEIEALVKQFGASDLVETTFDNDEIIQAEWLRLLIVFQRGYPEPQSSWVTDPVNYEDFCRECGTYRQVRPFRIAKEPALGMNDFMTLYWGSPIFCRHEVVNELRAQGIRGFDVWDVLVDETGRPSERVAQLHVLEKTEGGLMDADDLGTEMCANCGETKHYAHLRGLMHYREEALDPDLDLVATSEWFGAGGKSAFREILISNRFARLILEKGWQGVRMKVVNLEG